MANNIPLINGLAYDFTQISLMIAGIEVFGVSSISYSEDQVHANNYGTGPRPVSRGSAQIDCAVSLDIDMNEIEAIRAGANNNSLVQIPSFNILVVFGNIGKVKTHKLMNCQFLTDGVDASQGDTTLVKSFDLVASHIEYVI